jgi:hypothetical protein
VRGRMGGVWGHGCGLLAGVALIMSMSGAAAAATTWTIQASPNVTVPNGQVQAVSCRSVSACTAVGYYLDPAGRYVPLAQTWNGSSWTQQAAPSPAGAQVPGLAGVSCVSASFCEAVGGSDESVESESTGFAELWNGSSWSLQSLPSPAGGTNVVLKAVSCVSASFCQAVGSYTALDTILSLAEEWNGTAWTVQSTPNQSGAPTQLDGVSCVSATFCQAMDFYGAMAEVWNGTSWAAQSVPYPSGMTNPSLYFGVLPVGHVLRGDRTVRQPGCFRQPDAVRGGLERYLLAGPVGPESGRARAGPRRRVVRLGGFLRGGRLSGGRRLGH